MDDTKSDQTTGNGGMGKESKNNDDEPRVVVTKVTPQLMSLWNKELERLHKALIAAETATEDKEWIKRQIESLHAKVFGES